MSYRHSNAFPNIDPQTDAYTERRKRFFDLMDDGVAIVASALEINRNGDTTYYFRQESSFFYLTGLNEPDCLLVLVKSKSKCQSVLFLRPRDLAREQWDGRRLGVENACEALKLDQSFSIENFKNEIVTYLENQDCVYVDFYRRKDIRELVLDACERASKKKRASMAPGKIVNVQEILGPLRLRKDAYDIELMRKSASINLIGHKLSMTLARPGKKESDIEALLEYVYRSHGAKSMAYTPIVATGTNATILHYNENSATLNDGDLLLIDAGPEYLYYASDVTRTFPVNNKFSAPQKDLYEVVLAAQKMGIELVRPGANPEMIHQKTIESLSQGLLDLGILKGSLQEVLETKSYFRYYPHGTGHWLGLDVHDLGPYRVRQKLTPTVLEEGMCMTIEPGLYFMPEMSEVPKAFAGLGIRIEDDILVTKTGHENLTQLIPKEVKDVESVCQEKVEWPKLF